MFSFSAFHSGQQQQQRYSDSQSQKKEVYPFLWPTSPSRLFSILYSEPRLFKRESVWKQRGRALLHPPAKTLVWFITMPRFNFDFDFYKSKEGGCVGFYLSNRRDGQCPAALLPGRSTRSHLSGCVAPFLLRRRRRRKPVGGYKHTHRYTRTINRIKGIVLLWFG